MNERIGERESKIAKSIGSLWDVQCYAAISSTMDRAREAEPDERPLVVLAETQTSGRGRHGREWSSEKGGFYATYRFSHQGALSALVGFSLVVGTVIHEVVTSLGGEVKLKWPNDILATNGKKVGGVLIEIVSHGVSSSVLIGIGINLEHSKVPTGSSLKEITSLTLTPEEIVKRLSSPLLEAWKIFLREGFQKFKISWEDAACFRGERVRIEESAGAREGIFMGVSDEGALLLKAEQGIEKIFAGDVVRCRQA